MTDLTSLTLADAREGLAQKSFTALELTDAHLAALAISHGAALISCDNDFMRFKGLRWENPLGKPGRCLENLAGVSPSAAGSGIL